jgi:hypothetical protein
MTSEAEGTAKTPKTRPVLVMWVVITAAFVVFNSIYWPAHKYQQDRDPERYQEHARALKDAGQTDAAIACLRAGIDERHPPYAEPLELLSAWIDAQGGAADSDYKKRAALYEALESAPESRAKQVAEALDAMPDAIVLPGAAAPGIAQLAVNLGISFGTANEFAALPFTRQWMLLKYLYGDVSMDGRIGKTGVVSPVDLLVQSAGGEESKQTTHFFVAGQGFANNRRGLCAIFVDAKSGQLIGSGVFDIWASEDEAGRMVQALAKAPQGCIGVFAVHDEASENMTDALEKALGGFGLAPRAIVGRRPMLYGTRYAFAAIGVKGSAPGAAMQTWMPEHVDVHRGHPVACIVLRAERPKP